VAERTSITQVVQLGVEVTPGTAVPADRKLNSVAINLSPDGNINTYRASGNKFPSIAALGKEWAGGDIEGAPTYTELLYLLAGILGPPTTTGAGPYTHVWDIETSAVQDPVTFTAEYGSSFRAHRATGLVIPELSLSVTREEASLGGSVMGRAIEDNVVLTAAPTALALRPCLPTQFSIYADATAAGLGTTKLLRALSAEFTLGDRFSALWPINAAETSYAAVYEGEPSSEFALTMEADAAGMALLPVMRAGDSRFIRLEADGTGDDLLTIDLALKVSDMMDFSDEDGIYAVQWTLGLFDDPTWGKTGEITLVNDIANPF
jgi:hypothetical protein